MTEFLTWNAYKVVQYSTMQDMWLLLPVVTCIFAVGVTLLLDKYGAPDDDLCFDPLYDLTYTEDAY